MCSSFEECLYKLSEHCIKSKSPYSRREIDDLKDVFKHMKKYKSDFSAINCWFNLQGSLLSLECLWQLQTLNFIHFTSYIYFNADSVVQLSEDFETLIWCQDDAVRDDLSECVATLLRVLVNLGGHTPRDICKPGQQLLTLILEKFVDRLLRDPFSVDEPIPFLPCLLASEEVVPSRLRVFCLSLIRMMVQVDPGAVTVQEAIECQAEKFTTAKSPPLISQVFKEVLSSVTAEDFIEELKFCITSLQEQFNWCWLLTAVSVFVLSSVKGIASLKGVTEEWVGQACANRDANLLSSALLIARQCCAESPVKFCSYSAWFGGLQVRPASAFAYFFEFLSELVPHEPVLCLKIHVNKLPSPPPNCHSVIADYVVLAKTRLADLRQSTDYLGLFGEYTTTEQEGRKSDVAKVLAHFKQTKEIMKIVLEASVFRRQFYEDVFLTELLKDSDEELVELIEKLYSMGKIPHGMYSRWKQSHM
ncbi:Fanconi anemia group A protein homolog [Macrosteles quadrilineatus]|uniref:Fanconi anemia group A protein homolog n=1 Tax=Macrosteles quadrilineatus TaxID=74068 RepID=UPI0023E26E94|nr:Fanconi anemia group A protein homolog [Macrosteles quadrilineatus]